MALSFLNLGLGLYTENGYLPTDPGYPIPPDFAVKVSKAGSGYNYEVSERSAGAFTLFAIGNYLGVGGFTGDLAENANVKLKGNIVLGAVGLGYGADSLTVEGSTSLSVINTDDDPCDLLNYFFQGDTVAGLAQGASVSAGNLSTLMGALFNFGYTPPNSGYADKVEVKGDVNLSIIDTGLAKDEVKVGGGLQGAIVLLDGLQGIGGYGGNGDDKLEVNANSNLALVSCGAGKDTVNFKAGVTAVNVNGGDGDDSVTLSKGMLGTYQPDMNDPTGCPSFLIFDIPIGVIAGGANNDKITFGGGSSSYGAVVLGGDPFGQSQQTMDDDIVSFNSGSSSMGTYLKKSLVDLGLGADTLNIGNYCNTYKVILKCGGSGAASDGQVDTLNFSTLAGNVMTSKFDTSIIVGFGDEDRVIYAGTTSYGADARNVLLGLGFTVVPVV